MEEKLSIKLNIGDRFYPLKIDSSEEEKIRKAAKLIHEKLLQYKQKYEDKDMQDFLAMVTLQFAMKNIECDEYINIDSPLIAELQELEQELTQIIREK